MEEAKTTSDREAMHQALDAWIDGDGENDLLFRRERPEPPPYVPPMPKATPMRTGRGPTATFEALVPERLRSKKTGLNIALISDFDIAGRITGLMRLLNEYTIHRARAIVVNKDYLDYDKDIVVAGASSEDLTTAMAIVEEADVYHFGRGLTPILGIDWAARVRPDNALVQYFGTEIRNMGPEICAFHDQTGILGLSAWDYTMLQPHPLIYHVNNFFEWRKVKEVDHSKRPTRICHATTNRSFKKSIAIEDVLQRVSKRTGAEVIIIEGKSHQECLAIKQTCHITVDQLSSGIYGLSAIESMAMGHVVFCGMSNFAMSYYPDCPVVPFWDERSLEDGLVQFVEDAPARILKGSDGRHFVRSTADPRRVVQQHCWIYDLVHNGHRFVGRYSSGRNEHLLP